MLATVVAIFGIIVLFGGLLAFLWYAIPIITDTLNTILSYVDMITSLFPVWLLPFILIVLSVAVISIVVKCI